jgi:hypothetical protein
MAAPSLVVAQRAESTAAETLFQEGKRLLDQKDFAHACPKLAESYRLESATGTLLALAICHEGEGKTATAWAEYNESAARSKREGRREREQAAMQFAGELQPKLSTLTISISEAVARSGALTVKRDGVAVDASTWGAAVPVDPGEHVVALSATGKKPWSKTIVVGSVSDRQTVVAEPLEDALLEPGPPVEATSTRTSMVQQAGLIAAGAGVLGIGIGTYFGIKAIHENNSSSDGCAGNACYPDAKQTRLDARSDGNVSTAAFVAGGALLIGGAAMYVLGGDAAVGRGRIQAAPVLGKGQMSVALRGTF